MANQSKLKAWVRYDGTGRVVSGGPIFQVNKPKVGNWRQIDANLCCNGNTPTTTTTTTSGGGGRTPTAWFGKYSQTGNAWEVCFGSNWSTTIIYTSTSTAPIPPSTPLYSNALLTTVATYLNGVISINNIVYTIISGYTVGAGIPCGSITTSTSTTTQGVNNSIFRQSDNFTTVCSTSNLVQLFWIGELTNGKQVYTDQALTQGYFVFGYVSNTATNAIFQTSNGLAFNAGFC